MSFRTRRWHVPSRNQQPSGGKLRFAKSLHQSLSQFGQKYYRSMLVPCHNTMPSFMIFRRVLDLLEFKNQASECFAGNQRCPGVWNSNIWVSWLSRKDWEIGFLIPVIPKHAWKSWNLAWCHEMAPTCCGKLFDRIGTSFGVSFLQTEASHKKARGSKRERVTSVCETTYVHCLLPPYFFTQPN